MNKQTQLSEAILLAATAHRNQLDKGGKPYILHPLHLMKQLIFDLELATIAVLHDAVEDSDCLTIDVLEDYRFSKRIITAVDLLTHREGEDYLEEYIKWICFNYDAIRVKRKDLEHNSDITRLKRVRDKDLIRLGKYHKAFVMLGKAKEKFNQGID